MKKILCLILAVVCTFAIVSCGGDDTSDINNVIANSKPSTVKTVIEYRGADTLATTYTTMTDYVNNLAVAEYEFERKAEVGDFADTDIVTESGKVYYKDGKVTKNEGAEWVSVSGFSYQYKFDVSEKNLVEFEQTGEVLVTFTAKVEEAKIFNVLGTELDIKDGTFVSITLVISGDYLYSADVFYETASGANVSVKTSYEYAPVTLNFAF